MCVCVCGELGIRGYSADEAGSRFAGFRVSGLGWGLGLGFRVSGLGWGLGFQGSGFVCPFTAGVLASCDLGL